MNADRHTKPGTLARHAAEAVDELLIGAATDRSFEFRELIIERVLDILDDPDREMLEAGAMELAKALPPGATKAYLRNLAGVVFRAMLSRADA